MLVACASACAVAPPVHAQGRVTGVVRLLERDTKFAKNLADAIVYLESASAASHVAALSDHATIIMRNREFVPHVQVVRVGGTVAFPNKDPYSHNVFSNSGLGAFDLGLYRTSATRSAVMARPGVYPIHCNIHARMVSFVVALATPYVARVDRSGRFAIDGVPAGVYTVRAWHERAPEVSSAVSVENGAVAAVALQLDARNYVATAHLDKFGKPYAPTRGDRY
ncbi:MAG: methylamine utilization protein [Gemmatimonadaceae bacterium]|nr:methylamine utilization protein [Gemmatimonadaceae bacterium]